MRLGDFVDNPAGAYLVAHEKGGKARKLPAHHVVVEALRAYLEAGGLLGGDKKAPLFQSSPARSRKLSGERMHQNDMRAMVKRRCAAAGPARGHRLPLASRYRHHDPPGERRAHRGCRASRRTRRRPHHRPLRPQQEEAGAERGRASAVLRVVRAAGSLHSPPFPASRRCPYLAGRTLPRAGRTLMNYERPNEQQGSHPSGSTALTLAFVSILLGPITGIPAIYLARKALREAAAARERYSGANGAKGALVLGCAMSFFWTLMFCSGISSDSPTFAVIFVLIGLSIGALAIVGPNRNMPSVLTTLAGAARRHIAVLVLAPAFALGGIIGSAGHAQRAAEASRICTED